MSTSRGTFWLRIVALAVVTALLVVLGVFVAPSWLDRTDGDGSQGHADRNHEGGGDSDDSVVGAIPVQVIHPKSDPNFSISASQPAYVSPYYQVDLRSRVAGPVSYIRKDIGDLVKKGEVLIRISVPDLDQEVAKKAAVIKQREFELEVAKATRKKADAGIDIAKSTIKEKEGEVRVADATTSFRTQELKRFRALAKQDTVTANIVAEREKFAEAAEAAGVTARASVDRAKADEMGARAKLLEAIADEKLKASLIDIATEDWNLSQALLGFATLTAPFDGVITRRTIGPKSFVQNSTGSPGPALLTIERTDIVTLFMNLPDNYSSYIDDKTQAVIEMSELPGIQIRAQVTRFSPSLQTPGNDRTMRVEVDLYNRGPATWAKFLAREKETDYADLKSGKLPFFPEASSLLREKLGIKRLLPGMYGSMKLVLQKFEGAYLIPSQAVFSSGGKSFVFVVQDDIATRVPVEVQVDDGVLAKVVLVERKGGGEKRRELTGNEEIVLSNQGELTDGQRVTANLTKW